MQISTKAIVLYYTKYSDSSIILNLYTKEFGRLALIVYGIANKKKHRLTNFQPLYLLDCVLSFKASRQVQSLKELKVNPVLQNLSCDMIKSTQAMFLAEVLSKSLNNSEAEDDLFQFLAASIEILDALEKNFHLFHIAFLVKLSTYLGIWVEPVDFDNRFYDFRSGFFAYSKPSHPYYMSQNVYDRLNLFRITDYDQLASIVLSNADRNLCIETIIKLFEFHVTNFSEIKSYAVLQEVFAV